VLQGSILAHKVNLVLADNDMLELHDLDGSQVLGGLGLRAGFISGNQKKSSIHDGGTRQHSTHLKPVSAGFFVARTDKKNSREYRDRGSRRRLQVYVLATPSGRISHMHFSMGSLTDVAKKSIAALAALALTGRVDLL